jgi:hypothetical protein
MAFCAEKTAYAAVVEKTGQHYYREEAARVRRGAKIVANQQVRLRLLDIAEQYDSLADNIEQAGLYRGIRPPLASRGYRPIPLVILRSRHQIGAPLPKSDPET